VEVTYDATRTNPEELAEAITEHTDFEGGVKDEQPAGS
jgi:hypothetical protein